MRDLCLGPNSKNPSADRWYSTIPHHLCWINPHFSPFLPIFVTQKTLHARCFIIRTSQGSAPQRIALPRRPLGPPGSAPGPAVPPYWRSPVDGIFVVEFSKGPCWIDAFSLHSGTGVPQAAGVWASWRDLWYVVGKAVEDWCQAAAVDG